MYRAQPPTAAASSTATYVPSPPPPIPFPVVFGISNVALFVLTSVVWGFPQSPRITLVAPCVSSIHSAFELAVTWTLIVRHVVRRSAIDQSTYSPDSSTSQQPPYFRINNIPTMRLVVILALAVVLSTSTVSA